MRLWAAFRASFHPRLIRTRSRRSRILALPLHLVTPAISGYIPLISRRVARCPVVSTSQVRKLTFLRHGAWVPNAPTPCY
ncbi:hypothetical protein BGW80DRAFT_1362560 [Lactifluus volemus]|nr:hypothetical protein BGW80DRAFT_1362560 [Lactifluus volemus]